MNDEVLFGADAIAAYARELGIKRANKRWVYHHAAQGHFSVERWGAAIKTTKKRFRRENGLEEPTTSNGAAA
jgi:hypothetical protein